MNALMKDEIAKAGRVAGEAGFTDHIAEGERTWLVEEDRTADQATTAAVTKGRMFLACLKNDGTYVPASLVPGTPARREAFIDAYVKGFVSAWAHAKARTPAALERQKATSWKWLMDGMLDRSNLYEFKAQLDVNPAYAFEWASQAINDAARYDVAMRLTEIAEKIGIDGAVKVATREALNGARHGHHSTSEISNLVGYAKTAAYAQVVEHMIGRG